MYFIIMMNHNFWSMVGFKFISGLEFSKMKHMDQSNKFILYLFITTIFVLIIQDS